MPNTVKTLPKLLADDYGRYTMKRVVGLSALAGAIGGGALGANSVLNDKVGTQPYTEIVPKAIQNPPLAQDVFGHDAAEVYIHVKEHSYNGESADESMKYLSYLARVRPDIPAREWGEIYHDIDSSSYNDESARKTLALLGAYMEKNPRVDPWRAARYYLEIDNHSYNDDAARTTFSKLYGLNESDYTTAVQRTRETHSAFLGPLGLVGGTIAAMAIGATIGTGLGIIGGVILKKVYEN
ncbi:MAG: hypothetical protein HYU64_15825 [Armatimonadetes bacterium]|nr:hypothetical protein [Armatimonadota bacterium]